MKLGFLVFSNTAFPEPTRILAEATEFGVFDFIRRTSEKDIPTFLEKHSEFIRSHKKGYGLYIWKPKIILDTLLSMEEGDVLVYCDVGMKLNKTGLPRFHEYMNLLDTDHPMVVFSTNKFYVPQFFIKQDAIMSYFPEFNDRTKYDHYCYAGLMIIKKTEKTIQAVTEWLELCENYHFIHPITRSIHYKEVEGFQGNDCDSALFNLVLAKHQIHATIYPDETNLYKPSGVQDLAATNWSSLDAFPFQCRRLFPRT